MLGCSCQLSSSIAQHSHTQSPPPRQRTAQLDGRAGEARPEGTNAGMTGRSLLQTRQRKFFPAAGHARSQLFCPPIPPNQLSRRKQVLCFFPCTPRATALRQARVSGGNLQNCAPSAACGGAMTQERNVPLVSFIPLSFPIPKATPSSKAGGGRCFIAFYSCISAKHARRFTTCAAPCAQRGTASARTGRSGRGHRAQRRSAARPRKYPGRSPRWRGRSRAGDRSADAAGSRR